MKFSEWMPDRDDFENPGLTAAHNVLPGTFYKPIRTLSSQSNALDDTCIGGFSTKDDDGLSFNFAGTATKLYKLTSGSWSDIGTTYSTTGENRWVFKRFGNNIIASNGENNIQSIDIASENSFSNLGGTPPKAKHMAIVRDFLVLGNIELDSANKVQWSGINDITEWTAGQKESGAQVFPEGGAITGMIGGEYGLIFQENQITRMEYQGPPLNFSFDVIETGLGAITSGSIIRFGIQVFYLSNNGFYVTDGTQSFPIGTEKIDKYFFAKADELSLYKMTSAIDPINKLVIWSYASKTGGGTVDSLIIYNWDQKNWSEASLDHELIYTSLSEDHTLEDISALYATLDLVPASLDSRIWQGGTLVLSTFDTDHMLASFTGGSVLAGTLKTGEFELNEHQMTLVTQVWPEIDGSIDVKLTSRDTHQSAATTTGQIGVNSIGFSPFADSGRYHSFEFNFNNWTRATGFKLKTEVCGEY